MTFRIHLTAKGERPMVVDIEQKSILHAITAVEIVYEGYRAVKVYEAPDALLTGSINHQEGALGDFPS